MKTYIFKIKDKKEIRKLLNGSTIGEKAEEIGISRSYLSRVFNGWNGCSKFCAYAITKSLDSNKEINDLFEIEIIN